MKKRIFYLALAALALSLFGCAIQPNSPALYLEQAKLNAQEENIAKLLGNDAGHTIYDFVLDETVKAISISTYRLIDGVWNPISDGWQEFSDRQGRLALDFDNIADGLRIALQSKTNNGATAYAANNEESFDGMARATSILNNKAEIIYDQPIPLVLQISTTQNEIRSYDVASFFTPEQYNGLNYEHVYAVTIQFSQKTVEELTAKSQ